MNRLSLLAMACLALGASAFLPAIRSPAQVSTRRSLPSLPSRSRASSSSTTTKMVVGPEVFDASTSLVATADFAETVGGIADKIGSNPFLKFGVPFAVGCSVGLVINAFIIFTAWYIPPETMKGWQQIDDDTMSRVMGGENWEEIVAGSGGKYQTFPEEEMAKETVGK